MNIPKVLHKNAIIEAATIYQFEMLDKFILEYNDSKFSRAQTMTMMTKLIPDIKNKEKSCLTFSKLYDLFDDDTLGSARMVCLNYFRDDILKIMDEDVDKNFIFTYYVKITCGIIRGECREMYEKIGRTDIVELMVAHEDKLFENAIKLEYSTIETEGM